MVLRFEESMGQRHSVTFFTGIGGARSTRRCAAPLPSLRGLRGGGVEDTMPEKAPIPQQDPCQP